MKTAEKVHFVPKNHSIVSPYVVVESAESVVTFTKKVFGAEPLMAHNHPDGRVRHAEIKIGDTVIMLSEGGETTRPSPVMLHVYVEDVDAAYERAIDAGGASIMPPTDMYYGDRNCGVDAFGISFWIATHVEDVSNAELQRRSDANSAKERR
jgi:PhnB protein